MPAKYYQDKLYPFQDMVLQWVESSGVDFYLTGGTALSRCYLNHRYSDDLDFFINDNSEFKNQCDIVVSKIKKTDLNIELGVASESFLRIFLSEEDTRLKLDFINDVEFRYGDIVQFPIFYRIDNWRNILSNKVCALSRLETKDIVDILYLAQKYQFSWEEIIVEARKKDMWVSPIESAKIIDEFPIDQLETIKWIEPVEFENLRNKLAILHDEIFYGKTNSLYKF